MLGSRHALARALRSRATMACWEGRRHLAQQHLGPHRRVHVYAEPPPVHVNLFFAERANHTPSKVIYYTAVNYEEACEEFDGVHGSWSIRKAETNCLTLPTAFANDASDVERF